MFDESKHKRAPKGSSEGGRFVKTSDGAGGTHEATKAEKKRLSELGIGETTTKLTSQEWAMFYERIGKIKKEGHYVPKTDKGDMIIQIETKDRNVLVIASGTYQKPKVKYALSFERNDEMYKVLEILEDI